jgi:putative peptidoglycan binding protein
MNSEAEQSPDTRFVRPRPAPDSDDESFRQSLAELSRQLASRAPPPEPPPFDPSAADDLPAEPRERARRERRHRPGLALLALGVGFGLAAVIHAVISPAPAPPRPVPTVAEVVPAPPANPAPPPSTAELTPAKPVIVDPPPSATPVVVAAPEPPQPKGKLEAYEIMEIQSRLKAAGLNPGPLDGVAGSQTSSAVRQYQEAKGQPQTGKLDRNLLTQLRRDPQRTRQ